MTLSKTFILCVTAGGIAGSAFAAKPGRIKMFYGEFERDGATFSTKPGVPNAGGHGVFGRPPFEEFKMSVDVVLSKRGYSHAGIIFGLVPAEDGRNTLEQPQYLVTLHGGEGDCSVLYSTYEKATGWVNVKQEKVAACRGSLEIEAKPKNRGAVLVRFAGKPVLETRVPARKLADGYVGLRGGTSLGDPITFGSVDID